MKKCKVSLLLLLCTVMLSGCGSTIDSEPSSDVLNTDITSEISTSAEENAELYTEPATEKAPLITVDILPDYYQINVTPLLQNPELPSGCEITSLTCLLNYLGYPVDKDIMATTYLDYVLENGTNYSFYEKYIGDPHSNGYGCYSPVIVKAATNFLSDQNSSLEAVNISGSSKEDILKTVASGHPVVIWNTLSTIIAEESFVWTTPDGEDVYWSKYEHCMLLTGYNMIDGTVTVCDPMKGEVQYNMNQFFTVYEEVMHQQAMTIY